MIFRHPDKGRFREKTYQFSAREFIDFSGILKSSTFMDHLTHIFSSPESWIALLTLTALEIVLGIDNIIFISILVNKLEKSKQAMGRILGLALAMIMRIILLFSISFILSFTKPLFSLLGYDFSGRDIVLLMGGLFLIWKSTFEIHTGLEGEETKINTSAGGAMLSILIQIMLLDLVFSIDSVITAVGMVEEILIMVLAVMISVGVMMISAKGISEFVEEHPTVKMLALSFLILVGVTLIAESLDLHIPRGYIYFSLAFSISVEMINIRLRKRSKTIQLRKQISE